MGKQRKSESRAWSSVELASARAVEVWGEEALQVFRQAAATRTTARFRDALAAFAEIAEPLEEAVRSGHREMEKAGLKISDHHLLPADGLGQLVLLGVVGVLQERAGPAMKSLSQAADALAALRRDIQPFLPHMKAAPTEMTGLVARVRRGVPNAPTEPSEWGYAAIAAGFSDACSTRDEWQKVFGAFRKALDAVVSRAA